MGYNIGIIGFGIIGEGLYHALEYCGYRMFIYDKYIDVESKLKHEFNYEVNYHVKCNSIKDLIYNCDIIFICVPTPMKEDGSQDISIIENIIDELNESHTYTDKIEVVIRSTILPGTTRYFANKFSKFSFLFMPEFLSEKTYIYDSLNPTRIIIGCDGEYSGWKKTSVVFNSIFHNRDIPIYACSWEEAELSKYMANCFFAVKISFMNEMYDIAKKFGIDYNDLRDMLIDSGWVNEMHTQVPGTDGDRGYGGKCLVKDTKAFINWAKKEYLSAELCKAADKVNEKVRKNKNWFDIKGATTVNNYSEE
jgi:UDPglucose 6-dehydrogenase